MSEQKAKNPLLRFIGRTKQMAGNFGMFYKIMLNNPNPLTAEQQANPYYKGHLLWFDLETQKYYKVKQLGIRNASAKDQENGFINSITVDLGDTYSVDHV